MTLTSIQCFTIKKIGVPVETEINMIALCLSSVRVSHCLPISSTQPGLFQSLSEEMREPFFRSLIGLKDICDGLVLYNNKVTAKVTQTNRAYKIYLHVYNHSG